MLRGPNLSPALVALMTDKKYSLDPEEHLGQTVSFMVPCVKGILNWNNIGLCTTCWLHQWAENLFKNPSNLVPLKLSYLMDCRFSLCFPSPEYFLISMSWFHIHPCSPFELSYSTHSEWWIQWVPSRSFQNMYFEFACDIDSTLYEIHLALFAPHQLWHLP